MAKLYGKNPAVDFAGANLMSFGKSFSRLNGQPLDKSEVWYNYQDLVDYAKTDAAYVGQKVFYVEMNEDGVTGTVNHYSIEVDGSLKSLGQQEINITVTDDNVINLEAIGTTITASHAKKGPEGGAVKGATADASVSTFGGSIEFKVPHVTVDEYGHTTALDEKTVSIAIPEAPTFTDTNTTYGFAFDKATQKLTVTPSEGEAVELDLSDFLIASELPEDKNTEYHLEYSSDDKAIKLVAGADANKMSIDAAPFIKDGMLSDVDYDPTSNTLTFVWNTDSGLKADTVVLSDILDPYVAGDKIVIDGSRISHATIVAPTLVEGGSGRTYITELVSDGFGHITGYKVSTEADQVIPEYIDGDGIEVRDEEDSIHSINIKLADGESHLKITENGALAFDASGIDTDTNTTYGISGNGVSVTLTPSEGDATTVTLDAYTKSETDNKIDEKIASVTGGESAADVKLALESYRDAINTELWGESAKSWTSTTTDENGKVTTVYNPQYGTASRLDAVETKLLTVEENAQVNKIESVDANFVITEAKQLTLAEGKHLITDAQVEKLDGIAAGAEKNFISSVDETKFTVTEGKLLLKENYVTTTVYSAEVGDLTQLIRDEGRENTTLVDEINYINARLTWGEMAE